MLRVPFHMAWNVVVPTRIPLHLGGHHHINKKYLYQEPKYYEIVSISVTFRIIFSGI